MSKKQGSQTVVFTNKPSVLSYCAIAGLKEGQGNFKDYFDIIM